MAVNTTKVEHSYQPGAAMAAEALVDLSFTGADEIVVELELAAAPGVRTVLQQDADYSLTLPSGASWGTVRALAAYAPDDWLHVRRVTPRTQEERFEPFEVSAKAIERMGDKHQRIVQEQDAEISRTLMAPRGESGLEIPDTAARAGKYFMFDGAGLPALDDPDNFAALATTKANEASVSAATAESAAGPTYASTAAGLAATASGEAFAVDNGDGMVTVYLNSAGTAVAQRTLATTDALASTDAGKGAALVGASGGGTVQDFIDIFTAVLPVWPASPSTTDCATAIEDALAALPSTGGCILVMPGTYSIQSKVDLSGKRVTLRCLGTVQFNMAGAAAQFAFEGGSSASPSLDFRVIGGRFVAQSAATVGPLIRFANAQRWSVDEAFVSGYYSAANSVADTTTGIEVQYGIYGSIRRTYVAGCQVGYDIKGDAANSYRLTTLIIDDASQAKRCGTGVKLTDVVHCTLGKGLAIENCSVGVLLAGSRTSGTNCSDVDIRCYFERNGKHIQATRAGTASNYSIAIEGCYLENVNTTFVDGAAFEGGDAGTIKIDLDYCTNSRLGMNYWSSAASSYDLKIGSGCSGVVIDPQGGASGLAINRISNAGANTIRHPRESEIAALTDSATPSVFGVGSLAKITNASATTVTNFTGGYDGQLLRLQPQNGNTTIGHTASGTGIRTLTGANTALSSGKIYTFLNQGSGVWRQMT